MNITSALEKATLIFLVGLCYIATFNSVEAQRSVRVIKGKLPSPVHIHIPAGPGNGPYAKRYGYGRPGPTYNYQGKNKIHPERRNRKFGPRNYANDFRNWIPNRFQGGKYNPRADSGKYNLKVDNGKRGPPRPRKEPYTFIREPPYKNVNQKRKIKPQGVSHLQRPQPPRFLKDFDDEYYFPEEAIKVDSHRDFDPGYSKSKKKRRHPVDMEKLLSRPDSKAPYYSSAKPAKPTKQKIRDSHAGAGSYVKWPAAEDDDYDDVETPEYAHQSAKTKKKKLKKKSHSKKKTKDTDYDQSDTSGYDSDTTERSSKKRVKKQPYQVKDEEDGKYGNANGGSPVADDSIHVFKGYQKPEETSQFNPPYQQTWSQIVGTTQRAVPYNSFNNNIQPFQPQQFAGNQFSNPVQNPVNPYAYQNYVQKPQVITANPQPTNIFTQPDGLYPKNVFFGTSGGNVNPNNYNTNYINNQLSTERAQVSASFNTYSFPPTNSDYNANNQNYHSQYSNNQYNANGYVKNQSLSFVDNSRKYGNRLTASYSTGTTDAETDFLKKHQSLYNKGLTGVPIQGDGYRKTSGKGDYDIGFGDFQFDANTST